MSFRGGHDSKHNRPKQIWKWSTLTKTCGCTIMWNDKLDIKERFHVEQIETVHVSLSPLDNEVGYFRTISWPVIFRSLLSSAFCPLSLHFLYLLCISLISLKTDHLHYRGNDNKPAAACEEILSNIIRMHLRSRAHQKHAVLLARSPPRTHVRR